MRHRRDGVDGAAVADDFGGRLAAVEGERLALHSAVGRPPEPFVKAPCPMVVGDHPQGGRRDAGGGEPAASPRRATAGRSVAVEVGIDVQRVDVPGPGSAACVARTDVGEPDDPLAEPGDDHLAAVGGRAGAAATRRSSSGVTGGTSG